MKVRIIDAVLMALVTQVAGTAQTYISTIPGGSPYFSGAIKAGDALLNYPKALAADRFGNVYIADSNLNLVLRVTPDRTMSVYAGNALGLVGSFSGDGGPATQAGLRTPTSMAFDSAGALYIADRGNGRIRRVSPNGTITTIAGGGTGKRVDGVRAIDTFFNQLGALAVSASDEVYLALDNGLRQVWKVGTDGRISLVAGEGSSGNGGDNGPAVKANLTNPSALAFDPAGNLYIADSGGDRIRKVDTSGTITTLPVSVNNPIGLAVNARGEIFVAEALQIWKISGAAKTVYAGTGKTGDTGDNGSPAQATFRFLQDIALDPFGNLYAADSATNRVRIIPAFGNVISAYAGQTSTLIWNPRQSAPYGIAPDGSGGIVVAYGPLGQIKKASPRGDVTVIAGAATGSAGDGPALKVNLGTPTRVKVDGKGDVYFVDNHLVRRLSRGNITTLHTFPTNGLSPDGIAIHPDGSVYLTDDSNKQILKLSGANAVVVAGTGKAVSPSGDGGPATQARLARAVGLAIDSGGNLFFCDENRVRRISPDGIVTTVAGDGRAIFAGDGGPAIKASLRGPGSVAVDAAGTLFIADTLNNRVRAVTPDGIIRTIAGGGTQGYDGDGEDPLLAALNSPYDVAVDRDGIVYISDQGNARVRAIRPSASFVRPTSLVFAFSQGAAPAGQTVLYGVYPSSAAQTIRVFSQTSDDGGWLTVLPSPTTATANAPIQLTVVANPAGRPTGVYRGEVVIEDLTSAERFPISATMVVSNSTQNMLLSPTSLTFRVGQGTGDSPSQSVRVANLGVGSMRWSAAASTLSGGGWLQVAPSDGISVAGDSPPIAQVKVNASGLAPGSYYGEIQFKAPGAANSTQSTVVLMTVLPEAGVSAIVEPRGLIFVGGGVQGVKAGNPGSRAVSYTAAISFPDARAWAALPQADGSLDPGAEAQIDVQAAAGSLPPGDYPAELAIRFSQDLPEVRVALLLVIPGGSPAASEAAKRGSPRAGACPPPTRLLMLFQAPGAGFSALAGWSTSVQVRVVDECGVPFTSGIVEASFSDNSPRLPLQHLGGGLWGETWQNRGSSASVTIVATAQSLGDLKLQGSASLRGGAADSSDRPVIDGDRVVNAASFEPGAPIAAGSLAAIFGRRLADGVQTATPPVLDLAGTSVYLQGEQLPLAMATDGQLNLVIPPDITTNATHQLVIRRGNTSSAPEPVTIVSAKPGVFTADNTGAGQGRVFQINGNSLVLADSGAPARKGAHMALQCTGLGPVDGSVVSNPVSVLVGSIPAEVISATRSDTPGVYQVEFTIPSDFDGGGARVVLTVLGQSSRPVTFQVEGGTSP